MSVICSLLASMKGEMMSHGVKLLAYHWLHACAHNPTSRKKKKIPRGAMPKGGDNEQRKSKDSVRKLLSALIHCHPHVRCCCYSLDLGSKGFWIPEGCFTMRLSWKSWTLSSAWPPPSYPPLCDVGPAWGYRPRARVTSSICYVLKLKYSSSQSW